MPTIDIDSQGLNTIYAAGQVVTLSRRVSCLVQSAAAIVKPSGVVAWQVFQPLQNNTVDWNDDYYCFATTTAMSLGEVIDLNSVSASPVQKGGVYTFRNGSFSMTGSASVLAAIANCDASGHYCFGLAQAASINGLSKLQAICIESVLFNEIVYFQIKKPISIFLSSCNSGGTIIMPVSGALEIDDGQAATIGFNDTTNTFFRIS